jgi:hypothetical protein
MHDWLSRVHGVGHAGVKDNTQQRRGEAFARVQSHFSNLFRAQFGRRPSDVSAASVVSSLS